MEVDTPRGSMDGDHIAPSQPMDPHNIKKYPDETTYTVSNESHKTLLGELDDVQSNTSIQPIKRMGK